MLIDGSNLAQFIAEQTGGAIRLQREQAAMYGTGQARVVQALLQGVATPATFFCPEYYAAYGFKDQQWTGSCTAMETIAGMQRLEQVVLGIVLPLSGMFNYNYSYDGSGTRLYDYGATIGGALSTAQIFGTPEESLWPDTVPEHWPGPPPEEAIANAKSHRLGEFAYIGEGHDTGMRERIKVLIAGGAVIHFGIGNHALVMMEYDDAFYYGPNSKGGPDPNFNGKFGIHQTEVLPQCWSMYASFGINTNNPGPADEIVLMQSFHAMSLTTKSRLDTSLNELDTTTMTTPAEKAALVQQSNVDIQQSTMLGSMIAALTTSGGPPGPAQTTTTLGATPNPATVGATVTLRAIVAGSNPTGLVNFREGQSTLGSPVPLAGGVATSTTNTLGQGAHSLTANYVGDSGNAASTSSAVSITVNAGGGGGNVEVVEGGPPFTDPSGVVWKLLPNDPRYGGTVEHNGRQDNRGHRLVWDAATQKMKVQKGDASHPEIPYAWEQWTGSGYAATTAP